MYKKLILAALFSTAALMLHGCAPQVITPQPSYNGGSLALGPYPPSTRAGHPGGGGFYITMDSMGLGLEVATGPWRGSLYAGYYGFNIRNSWSQDEFGVSLDAAYNASLGYTYTDTNGDGYLEENYVYRETLGAALDGTYYFPVKTEIGSAYIGPRLRAYFACESEEGRAYVCSRYGLLPGGVIGINVDLTERLTFGIEGSVFPVIPGITDNSRFTVFSPFSLSLSYRF